MTAKIMTAEDVAERYAPLLDLYGALLALEEARAENERLREYLSSALETLRDAGVCDDKCSLCNEAFAALEKQP
jgi:hypothetical protein